MTTIRIWKFNISFIIDRKSIQRISKYIQDLQNTISELDLTDVYRILYPNDDRIYVF